MSRSPASRDRGSALLWVLFVVMVVGGYVLFSVQADMALDLATRVEVESPEQACAVAEAGLVDAFAWLRRQLVQPVTTFAPRRDLTTVPPTNETDDPTAGLVRDYEIAPDLWARYEVRRTRPAEPFTDLDGDGRHSAAEPFQDDDGNGRWDPARETRDVSVERGEGSAGAVWLLVSHGTVFARPRQDLPLGEGPNVRLARVSVATEVRRLALHFPSQAGICAARGDRLRIGPRSRIRGGAAGGVVYASATGSPVLEAGAEVSGTPSTAAVPDYDGRLESVFGVSTSELRAMADVATADPAGIPSPLGDYTLVVIDGDATFDLDRPLRGTAIVVVLGDCTLESGSNSFFNGLLWVGGDLDLRAPCYVRGTIVAEGSVDVRGTGGDYAEVDFDAGILNDLLTRMGQYRHNKAVFLHDPDRIRRGLSALE